MNSKKLSQVQSAFLKQRKAQIQMSIGTIVAIVLFMVFMVLGLVLVRTIFTGSIENINSIDQAVKNEINKLFAEDDSRKIVVYPGTREITIQKGNSDYRGFAFSIRNVETTPGNFTYNIFVNDPNIMANCNINANEAESWIKAGRAGSITIPAGDAMSEPEFVRFLVPDNAPPCPVRFGIDVKKDGAQYGSTINVDVRIIGR